MNRSLIVIPARMSSTRFPNKPFASICGIAMCERVWKIAKAVKGAKALIATDDLGLAQAAEKFGAEVAITQASHATGTDRVAEVALKHPEIDIFITLQGDAPLTPPWVIEQMLQEMIACPDVKIATPAIKLLGDAKKTFIESKQAGSSTGTSVVFDKAHNALYFSKALLPFARNKEVDIYRHIGLYAYRRKALLELTALPQTPLEQAESLEQLRALENEIPIRVVEVDYRGRTHGSVDRPEDIAAVEAIIKREGELLPKNLLHHSLQTNS